MAANMTMSGRPLWRRLRWGVWGAAALLLLLPLVAMQFSDGVEWTLVDFATMGAMLALVGGAYELTVRVARNNAYVLAAGVAVAAAFLMTWINLAVGMIGNENNPANQMFFGVLAIGFIASLFTRLKPLGMARAMEVMALAQGVACVVTLLIGEGHVFVLTGFFVAMWLLSAQLFRKAARLEAGVNGGS